METHQICGAALCGLSVTAEGESTDSGGGGGKKILVYSIRAASSFEHQIPQNEIRL